MRDRDWQSTTATVYTIGSVDPNADGGPNNLVIYSYKVDGSYYSGEFVSAFHYEAGDEFTLRYDRDNPEINERNLPPHPFVRVLCNLAWLLWLGLMIFRITH